MIFCTIHNVFCSITHIADTHIIINANGYELISSLDALLIF
jgi:hypothetical protein